jgi:hypothetical protein
MSAGRLPNHQPPIFTSNSASVAPEVRLGSNSLTKAQVGSTRGVRSVSPTPGLTRLQYTPIGMNATTTSHQSSLHTPVTDTLSTLAQALGDTQTSADMELARSMLRRSFIEIQRLQALLDTQAQRLRELESRNKKTDDHENRCFELAKSLESEKSRSQTLVDRVRESEDRMREMKSLIASKDIECLRLTEERKRARSDAEDMKRRINDFERNERQSAEEKGRLVSASLPLPLCVCVCVFVYSSVLACMHDAVVMLFIRTNTLNVKWPETDADVAHEWQAALLSESDQRCRALEKTFEELRRKCADAEEAKESAVKAMQVIL